MIIGAIGSWRRARVCGGGSIVLGEGTSGEIELSWWVGADDRWHVPERAITARQHLVRDLPIVQTSVRVPGGDAIATAFVTVQGPRELVVLDVENRSKLPFALALALRGRGVRNVTLDGSVVRIDGVPSLFLPRRPQKMAVTADCDTHDIRDVVMSGGAVDTFNAVEGPSSAAFVLPVTHATTSRCAALLGVSSGAALLGAPVLSSLPSVHTLANGWSAQLGRGVTVKVPDASFTAKLSSHAAALLLAAEPAVRDPATSTLLRAVLADALDGAGFTQEAGALLEDMPDRQGPKGAFPGSDSLLASAAVVTALGTHAMLTRNIVFASAMSPTVAGAIEFVARRVRGDALLLPWLAAVRSAVDVFQVAGEGGAAKQAMRMWEKHGSPWPLPPLPVAPLPAVGAGGSLVPDDPQRVALAVRGLVDALVTVDADGAADLLCGFDESWRGQPIEVRNVATSAGRLSYAIRWHGARPALLWEVEPVADADAEPLRLRATSIDPGWSGTGHRGDALLR